MTYQLSLIRPAFVLDLVAAELIARRSNSLPLFLGNVDDAARNESGDIWGELDNGRTLGMYLPRNPASWVQADHYDH